MLDELIKTFQRNLNAHVLLEHEKEVYYNRIRELTALNVTFNAKMNKVNYDAVDDYMFLNITTQFTRLCVIADWLYSKRNPRRLDFIEEIILPSVDMLKTHFVYFNRKDILKKLKLKEGTKIFTHELLPLYRYLWESPESEFKTESLDKLKQFTSDWRKEICSEL